MSVPSNRLLSSQNPKSILGVWLFAVFWCGISFTVFWAFAFQARDVFGGAIGGLFSLIGLVMLYGAVSMTLEYLKYGRVEIALDGEPATGRSFGATLRLPADAAAAGKVSAELACVRVTWSRGSKGGLSKGEQDAWTGKRDFPVFRGGVGGYAKMQIEVPAGQPASDVPGEPPPDAMVEIGTPAGVEVDRAYHRWELRVKADVPGIDLDRSFRLRVAPGSPGLAPQPVAAPAAPRFPPVIRADIEQRVGDRRAANRRLSLLCAFIGFAPFVVPFAIAGLAVGLAGCPMGFSASRPPSCAFAGIDWGPVMARAFDLMFVAVPAGIAGSAVIYFLGQLWLDRRHGTDGFGGRGGLLIALAAVGFFVYQAWQFGRPFERDRPAAAEAPQPAAAEAPPARGKSAAASGTWQEHDDEEARLKQALADLERDGVAATPAAARAYYRLGEIYGRQQKFAEQEGSLLAALAILERRPVAETRQALGAGLDKEIVARRLGDFYWDRRNYGQSYVHFDKAYRYAAEVQVSDAERNRRLAHNSAGRMAGACTQRDWAVADEAMKELKERIAGVDEATRRQLEYWIRTGEPRLAARKC